MSVLALLRFWREGIIAALLLAITALWIGRSIVERQNSRLKTSMRDAAELIGREREGVRAMTELARAKDVAHAAIVERNQVQATQEVLDDYQKNIANLRSRHDALRMRPGASATDSGRGGTAAVSVLPSPSASADGAAGEARLPSADRLIASEQALRLKALQDWVREQDRVERGLFRFP